MLTVAQWSEIYGVIILDADGFRHMTDRDQQITQKEFETGVVECTMQWNPSGLFGLLFDSNGHNYINATRVEVLP
jgi:hypothetical protein